MAQQTLSEHPLYEPLLKWASVGDAVQASGMVATMKSVADKVGGARVNRLVVTLDGVPGLEFCVTSPAAESGRSTIPPYEPFTALWSLRQAMAEGRECTLMGVYIPGYNRQSDPNLLKHNLLKQHELVSVVAGGIGQSLAGSVVYGLESTLGRKG